MPGRDRPARRREEGGRGSAGSPTAGSSRSPSSPRLADDYLLVHLGVLVEVLEPDTAAQALALQEELPMTTRATGIALAFVTAVVSGVAVHVNSRGVAHFGDATVYTTAKNALAGALLPRSRCRCSPGRAPPRTCHAARDAGPVARGRGRRLSRRQRLVRPLLRGALTCGCNAGRVHSQDARRLGRTLRRPAPARAARASRMWRRSGLVLAGQAWLRRKPGTVAFGAGETMILAATLFWAVEVVLVKRLLDVLAPRSPAAARMAVGTVVLVGWLAHGPGERPARAGRRAMGLAALTGLLFGYVASWYAALARAQAVDVTAVFVFGASSPPDREGGRRSGVRPGRPDPRHRGRGADRAGRAAAAERAVAAP